MKMSTRKIFLPLLALILAVAACRFTERANQTQPEPAPVIPTEAATDIPSLSPAALQNAEVILPASNTKCTLVNGECRNGDVSAHIGEPVGVGDVNGDGVDELVFIIGENTGGSGTFVALEIAEDNLGEPLVSDTLSLGDRVAVNSIVIQNGLITLDMRVHAPNDPLCCPSQPSIQTYQATEFSGLVLVRQTTQTPTGAERSIIIESPAIGESVGSSVHVTGRFTISPFENTLVYLVYDELGVPVAISAVTVNAPEMGGPGTFDFTIDLPAEVKGNLRIELKDVSAADGSILALDSVNVVVK